MLEPIPLEILPAGAAATVEEIVGSADAVVRLEELGFRHGRRIEMVQPGSPCIVRIDGHKLCIRDGEAFAVLVRPEAPR